MIDGMVRPIDRSFYVAYLGVNPCEFFTGNTLRAAARNMVRTFADLKGLVYVMPHDNKAKIHRIPDQHPDKLHLPELVGTFGKCQP